MGRDCCRIWCILGRRLGGLKRRKPTKHLYLKVMLRGCADTSVDPKAWFEGGTEDDLLEEAFFTWTDTQLEGTHLDSPSPVSSNSNTLVQVPNLFPPISLPQLRNGLQYKPTRHSFFPIFNHRERSFIIPTMNAQFPDSTVGLFYPVASETGIGVSHSFEDTAQRNCEGGLGRPH